MGEGEALYVRVSSPEQDLEGQERELREEGRRRGWVLGAVYREKVSATGRVQRPEYDRMLRDASRPGRTWDHLLVWSLDRLSRAETFTRATQAILDLERLGVRFHSLKALVLDTPEDGKPNLGRDVLLALLPVIASFESTRRSERVRVAMDDIKAGRRRTGSGKPMGRPRRVTPEKLAEIQRLRLLGLKWSDIARKVGLPRGTCAATASYARRGIANTHGRDPKP
jgi:DNA invertase Pin-like site-specific DNA recombinase